MIFEIWSCLPLHCTFNVSIRNHHRTQSVSICQLGRGKHKNRFIVRPMRFSIQKQTHTHTHIYSILSVVFFPSWYGRDQNEVALSILKRPPPKQVNKWWQLPNCLEESFVGTNDWCKKCALIAYNHWTLIDFIIERNKIIILFKAISGWIADEMALCCLICSTIPKLAQRLTTHTYTKTHEQKTFHIHRTPKIKLSKVVYLKHFNVDLPTQ